MKPFLLVVDDDVLILELLVDILCPYYPVVAMTSPLKAALLNPFNLLGLVTDWHMKELSGLTLIRKMRILRHDLPVVVISGEISEVLKELHKFPINGGWEKVKFVPKPFEIDFLLNAIHETIGGLFQSENPTFSSNSRLAGTVDKEIEAEINEEIYPPPDYCPRWKQK